jgi:4a-hydroxytetrahydrobiopterin dehydratase
MGQDLADRECVPCKGGVPPLGHDRVAQLLRELSPEGDGWRAPDDHHLERRWKRRNFAEALDLVNRIGRVAEAQRHHPEVRFGWGFVEARIWTHKIDGLTESDFVLAAKLDREAAQAGGASSSGSGAGAKPST